MTPDKQDGCGYGRASRVIVMWVASVMLALLISFGAIAVAAARSSGNAALGATDKLEYHVEINEAEINKNQKSLARIDERLKNIELTLRRIDRAVSKGE